MLLGTWHLHDEVFLQWHINEFGWVNLSCVNVNTILCFRCRRAVLALIIWWIWIVCLFWTILFRNSASFRPLPMTNITLEVQVKPRTRNATLQLKRVSRATERRVWNSRLNIARGVLQQNDTSHQGIDASSSVDAEVLNTGAYRMVHFVSGWTRSVQVKLWEYEILWERVPYLSTLKMCSRRGAIYKSTFTFTFTFIWWHEKNSEVTYALSNEPKMIIVRCP